MGRDHHSKPFDEGTKTKLALFEKYLEKWFPVFVPQNWIREINVFDFFSGPGEDITGTNGSPLIILDGVEKYGKILEDKRIIVNLRFNEFKRAKKAQLDVTLDARKPLRKVIRLETESLRFDQVFKQWLPEMAKSNVANLLFLDQSGIKFASPDIFRRIIQLRVTDFIFFISSSTIHRFKQHPDIVKYIDLPESDFNSSNYLHIHRLLVEFYKSLIPSDRDFHIAGFSIKKGSNIYGLVFGSGHILGMKKFLEVAWDLDPDRGEADFDIDEEGIDRTQPSLWPEMDIPRKLMKFDQELASQILCGELKTNNELYLYTIENGFLLKHSRNLVNRLIKEGSLPKQKINISDEAWKKAPQPIRLKDDAHG